MKKNHHGFSLIELLFVVAIISILYSFIVPSYSNYMIKAKRIRAESILEQAALNLEAYYLIHHTYQGAKLNIKNPISNGSYRVHLKLSSNDFSLIATPLARQQKDKQCTSLSLTASGERRISGSGTLAECWS